MCDINTNHPRAPIARRRHTRARNAHPSSCPPPFNSLPPPSPGARSTRRRALGDAPRTYRARRIAIVSYRAREIRRRARVFERGFRFEGISRVARGDRAARKRARGRGGGGRSSGDRARRDGAGRARRRARGFGLDAVRGAAAGARATRGSDGARRGGAARRAARGRDGMDGTRTRRTGD